MKLKQKAWIGDAILYLYVRELIIIKFGKIDCKLESYVVKNSSLRHFCKVRGLSQSSGTEFEAIVYDMFKEDSYKAVLLIEQLFEWAINDLKFKNIKFKQDYLATNIL